jgi:hypothetical protein
MFAKAMRGEWYASFTWFPSRCLPFPRGATDGASDSFFRTNSACPRYSLELPASADVKCVFPQPKTCLLPVTLTYGVLSTLTNAVWASYRIRLQPQAPTFVRVELFSVTGQTPVTSSGAFTDARSGAVTAQVALRAGQYFIEPTVDGIPSADRTFSLTVYSSSAGISLTSL